ncbi:AMP-binding protein [Pseudomonas aeruginosa]
MKSSTATRCATATPPSTSASRAWPNVLSEARGEGRRHGGGDGLGQPSLPGMHVRHPDDRGGAAYHQHPPLPEQILYTMNHAEDRFVLVNSEFVPLYQAVAGRLATVERTILLTDGAEKSAELPGLVGEYEVAAGRGQPTRYDFPDFDENSIATTFYTTGTTGNPKVCISATGNWSCTPWRWLRPSAAWTASRLLGTSDVYMPITPMFHVHAGALRTWRPCSGSSRSIPGVTIPELLVELWKREKVTFSHCVPTILQMVMNARAPRAWTSRAGR